MKYRTASYADGVWDTFIFEKNILGDVIAVYSSSGTKLISYTYDAYGIPSEEYFNNGYSTGATNNHLRYRGYYYDSEATLYYLSSRYYDPISCRFISADSYVSTGQGILGNNMFAYCNNNPIMNVDYSGEFPWLIVGVLVGGAIVGGILGANADKKLNGYSNRQPNDVTVDMSLQDEAEEITHGDKSIQNDQEELTVGDRVANIVVGAGLGTAAGGLAIILIGAGASLWVGSASATIGFLGMTGFQAVASGILAHNCVATLITPLFLINLEPIDYEYNPYQLNAP